MDTDDDMIMIIVGDDGNVTQPIKVKEEAENDDQAEDEESEDPMDVENVQQYLEAAEKYGELVPVEFIKREYDERSQGGGTDLDEEPDYLEDFSADDDECLSKIAEKLSNKTQTVAQIRNTSNKNAPNSENKLLRRRMLRPHERKSFVHDLKKEYPELKHNQQLLIEKLASIMRNTKPPPPPDGFCGIDNTGETSKYVCVTCGVPAANIGAISRHYQLMHGERYLVCFACGVDFRDVTNLYKHEKKCLSVDATVVLKARAIAVGFKGRARPYLPTKEELIENKKLLEQQQVKKRLPCSYCPATFVAPLALDAHENLHRGERPYVCDCCMTPYGSYPALIRHRKNHEGITYICDLCGGNFKSKITLRAHLNTHNPERKFACELCDKRYSQKMGLDLHIRTYHENLPPPCACQLCPKRYARNSLLKIHMRKVHGLDLITRNMFIKSLPRLTDMELEQAKVVMKSDIATFPHVVPPIVLTDQHQPYSPFITKRVPKPKYLRNNTPKTQGKVLKGKRIEYEEKTTPACIVKQENYGNDTNNEQKVIENNKQQKVIKNYNQRNVIVNNNQQKVIVETNEEVNENQIIVDISDTDLSAEVLQFVQKLQAENKEKVVLLDHGKVVHLVDSESEALKLMEELQSNQESVEIEDISKYNQANQCASSDEVDEKYVFYDGVADDAECGIELTKLQLSVNPEIAKRQILDTIEAQLKAMETDNPSTNSNEKQGDYELDGKAEGKDDKQKNVKADIAESIKVDHVQKKEIKITVEIEEQVTMAEINRSLIRISNEEHAAADAAASQNDDLNDDLNASQSDDMNSAETQKDDIKAAVLQKDETTAVVVQKTRTSERKRKIITRETVKDTETTDTSQKYNDDSEEVASQKDEIKATVAPKIRTSERKRKIDTRETAEDSQTTQKSLNVDNRDDSEADVSGKEDIKADVIQKQKTRTSERKQKMDKSDAVIDTKTTDENLNINDKDDSEAVAASEKEDKKLVVSKTTDELKAALQLNDDSKATITQKIRTSERKRKINKNDSTKTDTEITDTIHSGDDAICLQKDSKKAGFSQNEDSNATTSQTVVLQNARTSERIRKIDKSDAKADTEMTNSSQKRKTEAKDSDNASQSEDDCKIAGALRRSKRSKGAIPEI